MCFGIRSTRLSSSPARLMRRIEPVTISVLLPVMTVESYWPYATTLFDYVRRAMPFQAPGSLTADEVYSVSAYILAEANMAGSRRLAE